MNTNTIFAIGFVLLILLVVYYFFNKIRMHYVLKKQLSSNRLASLDLIDLAITQRSNFIIGAMHTGQEDRNIIGFCYKMDINALYIIINDSVRPLGFIDEDVKVYFSVLYKSRPVYYQFSSHVNDILTINTNYALSISIPDRLDAGQKRSYIRIAPQKDAILAMSIWTIPEGRVIPTSLDTVSQANYNFRPDYVEEIILENVSAGGMLLLADTATANYDGDSFKKNEQLLIFLVLRSDQNQKPISFWLVGNVILTKHNPMIKNQLIINVSLSKWAIMENDNTISWFSTGKNGGAPPLANWVLRHHLEQNKLM